LSNTDTIIKHSTDSHSSTWISLITITFTHHTHFVDTSTSISQRGTSLLSKQSNHSGPDSETGDPFTPGLILSQNCTGLDAPVFTMPFNVPISPRRDYSRTFCQQSMQKAEIS